MLFLHFAVLHLQVGEGMTHFEVILYLDHDFLKTLMHAISYHLYVRFNFVVKFDVGMKIACFRTCFFVFIRYIITIMKHNQRDGFYVYLFYKIDV